MNLSPDWVDVFEQNGIEAVHWSTVGHPGEIDQVILAWAKARQYIVFTHDLDFGTLLAATQADAPSVIQVRTQDPLPSRISTIVLSALQQFQQQLEEGALVTIDAAKAKVRVLPILPS
ncbi:DUF5615 family PIN-like protein [Leptolyngbya sp. AN03gr2]|uniref:DUF5615 family PIN-like protein n=1 Tax=unclassified Leptolyngbya TaxID=2650499 RepID=UPI003D3242E9